MSIEFNHQSQAPRENMEQTACGTSGADEASGQQASPGSRALSRRAAIGALGAGAVLLKSGLASAQAQAPARLGPPSTVTTPPRDFGPGAPPTTYFTDPDIITV